MAGAIVAWHGGKAEPAFTFACAFAEDLALDMVHLRIAIAKLQKDG